jgi:hypothetical protein
MATATACASTAFAGQTVLKQVSELASKVGSSEARVQMRGSKSKSSSGSIWSVIERIYGKIGGFFFFFSLGFLIVCVVFFSFIDLWTLLLLLTLLMMLCLVLGFDSCVSLLLRTASLLCCALDLWSSTDCFLVLWFVGMDPTVPSIWAHSPAKPHHT